MNPTRWLRNLLLTLTAVLLTLSFAASAAQNESNNQKESKKEAKEERKEAAAQSTPVLWKEPTDIASLDLFNGPGGEGMKPDLSQVIWEGEDNSGGYSLKWNVRDGAGKKWTVKLGNESQPETVALRLVWSAGYMTEINYLVPCVHIVNAPKPSKQVGKCEKDGFANVRFKARPEGVKKLDNWSWKDNPFKGTKELQGLVVLMGLLNNWDLKEENNKILFAPGGDGEQGELHYTVTDLGATFGKTGGAITRSRNKPKDYVKSGFIEKVEGDRVKFTYHGKQSELFDDITVEQAKWVGDILSQLSKQQIDDAFRAGNYKPEEIEALSYELRARINELHSLHAPDAGTGQSN